MPDMTATSMHRVATCHFDCIHHVYGQFVSRTSHQLVLVQHERVQVQPDGVMYNLVLAALLDAEQVQACLAIVDDMRMQGLALEPAACHRLPLLLMLAGELELACKVTQVTLSFSGHHTSTCTIHCHWKSR